MSSVNWQTVLPRLGPREEDAEGGILLMQDAKYMGLPKDEFYSLRD